MTCDNSTKELGLFPSFASFDVWGLKGGAKFAVTWALQTDLAAGSRLLNKSQHKLLPYEQETNPRFQPLALGRQGFSFHNASEEESETKFCFWEVRDLHADQVRGNNGKEGVTSLYIKQKDIAAFIYFSFNTKQDLAVAAKAGMFGKLLWLSRNPSCWSLAFVFLLV